MKSALDLPRYKENPIYLFFESYIVHAIGKMSEDRYGEIQELNLQQTFKTKASDWKDAISEVLNLSDTIDVAILDLWYRNRDGYDDDKYGYHAFAQDFTDHYMAEDSKVDVWPEGALDAARARIKEAEHGEGGKASPATS